MQQSAARDVLKLVSGTVAARIIGIGAIGLFAHILSREQLAVIPAYLMLSGAANLLFNLGIFPIFVKLVPALMREDRERARSLILTGSALVVAGTVLVSVGVAVFGRTVAIAVLNDGAMDAAVRLMCLGFPAFAICKLVEFAMWGRGQFAATSAIQVMDSVFRPLACVAGYFLFGVYGIVLGLVTAHVALAIASLVCVRDLFRGAIPRVYPIGELLKQSMPFYLESYLMFARNDGDNWFVTFLLGPGALAEYFLAKTFYSTVIMFSGSVDKVIAERLARETISPAALAARFNEIQTRLSRAAPPLIFLLIAVMPQMMAVLAGNRYSDAVAATIVLLLLALFQTVTIPIDRTVFVATPSVYRLSKTLVESVGVVVSVALLAPFAGVTGIAAGRLIGQALAALYGLVLIYRRLHIRVGTRDLFVSLGASLPATLAVLLLAPSVHGVVATLVTGLLAGAVWCGIFVAIFAVLDRRALAEECSRAAAAIAVWRLSAGRQQS